MAKLDLEKRVNTFTRCAVHLDSAHGRDSGQGRSVLCLRLASAIFKVLLILSTQPGDRGGTMCIKAPPQRGKVHTITRVWVPSAGMNFSEVNPKMFRHVGPCVCVIVASLGACFRWFQAHCRQALLTCWVRVSSLGTIHVCHSACGHFFPTQVAS